MKKHVYEIDEMGFLKEVYLADVDSEGNILDEDKQGFITVDYPSGLWKRKWTGSEWIEGESEEEKAEREAQQLLESIKPSPTEIADAELEIKLITILTELGVTQ
ncbi:hypothetical protein [Lysinibacillus capsici]|uniref:hypothetical protein n=1 Tax=Lysinibacillus capsici TaxID=2115968 RepID=UPI0036924CBF